MVARTCRCAVLSGISDDLAPLTLALFKTTVYLCRTTHNLDRGGPFDVWDDLGNGAILVAPRWDKRIATALDPLLGLRHPHRLRGTSVAAPTQYVSH